MDVRNNEAANRYEVETGHGIAVAEYVLRGRVLTLTHTEVPDAVEGRGIGGALIGAALEDAEARHLKVAPRCPYALAYLRRHPEHGHLVHRRYRHLLS